MSSLVYHATIEAQEKGERLRRLRNLANLSRKELCENSNININTYIGYEVGKYGGLTPKGAQKIIDYLSSQGVYCSLDWLMEGAGKSPQVITNLGSSGIESEEQKIRDELMIFRSHYENAIDYQIVDNGMLPLYEVESYVAGIRTINEEINSLIGFDCIVQTKNGSFLVRNLRNGRIPNTYTLVCINPETLIAEPILYDVELTFAAKIIWHRKIHK